MTTWRNIFCLTVLALTGTTVALASSIGIITNSGSNDAVHYDPQCGCVHSTNNSFTNENIANGTPDPGNGTSGTGGWPGSGSTSGNQFADSAISKSSDLAGITSGLAIGSASLLNGTVFGYNSSGYQSSATVYSNWSESLTWAPLPGQAVGSLVPVTFTINADVTLWDQTALSGFTSFDFSVQLPDMRDSLGNYLGGAQVAWSSEVSSDGFGYVSTFNRFCDLFGTCSNLPSFSGTNVIDTFNYALAGGLGVMSTTVQGYVVSGTAFEVGMGTKAYSSGDDASTNFSNTGWLTIDSPTAYTSESGVFLSETYSPSSAAPEPAAALYVLSGLAAVVWLRRKARAA
jgi:hypothetical protein